jgi:heat shock protein HtpX
MKRILLFAAVNIAVLAVITAIVELLGLDRYLAVRGLSLTGLLVLSAIFGFGGAFISLALSKWMAKISMGVRVIGEPQSPTERWLLEAVRAHATRLGLTMPEVGIFQSPTLNAFATGARRNRALVAVSSGLLEGMNGDEVQAVLGHELTHVANGDMVTLALLQGVLNTFVIFLARVVGTVIDSLVSGQRDERSNEGMFYFATVIVLQIVFGVLATLIVMAYSRRREYRADAGGARLAGRVNMIDALRVLQRAEGGPLPGQLKAFGIHDGVARGLAMRLFMSHPPLEERIAALEALGSPP